MNILRSTSITFAVSIACFGPIAAQSGPPADPEERAAASSAGDLGRFRVWLKDYGDGAIRMMKDLSPDTEALADAERRIRSLASWNDLPSAKAVFAAACIDPVPPGALSSTDRVDFQSELMPWRIRAFARDALAESKSEGLQEFLFGCLDPRKLRDEGEKGEQARLQADAAIRVLGALGGAENREAIRRATGQLPEKLRIRAVDTLASHAELGQIQEFFDLIRDKRPDVRILAARGIARALAPHTDETKHDTFSEEVLARRDQALKTFERLVERDKIWQVRAAAAEGLAEMRTSAAIPVLIGGYAAELKKKKGPWAMDLRFHRLLVGLTGQKIPAGDAGLWKKFWKDVGPSFRFAKEGADKDRPKDDRYSRFFSIGLESDRVLFVVDFSGSMKEEITLRTSTTSTKSGTKTTKAKLVVDELRRIVLALPEQSYFNIVVFSDGVRVWRPSRAGRPELVRLNDDARDDLLGSFLQSLQPRGPTNLYGALDTAIGFAGGQGLKDKYYDVGFDTIYVLSDGAPSYGPVTDKDEIRRLVRETNRLKRLTIHAITFGSQNDTEFLRKLAEENGGRHVHVD